MAEKGKSSWVDLFITAIYLERNSKSGRLNMLTVFINFALVVVIVPVKGVEIVTNALLMIANKKPYEYIPEWLAIFLVLLTVVSLILCMAFLVYADWKLGGKE